MDDAKRQRIRDALADYFRRHSLPANGRLNRVQRQLIAHRADLKLEEWPDVPEGGRR